jgi:hypothetical protein
VYEIGQEFTAFSHRHSAAIGTAEALQPIDEASRQRWIGTFQKALGMPLFIEWLPFSAIALRELVSKLEDPNLPIWEAGAGLRDFCERLRHELATHYYVQLDQLLVLFYGSPRRDWEPTLTVYPQLGQEIEEASKCLGLERYTACGFHLMRIMEFGLHSVRQLAGAKKKPVTWDGILVAIDKKLSDQKNPMKKTKKGREKLKLLAESAMYIRAAKDAWRNPTMHDYTRVYGRGQAIETYQAVQGFMNGMAKVHK